MQLTGLRGCLREYKSSLATLIQAAIQRFDKSTIQPSIQRIRNLPKIRPQQFTLNKQKKHASHLNRKNRQFHNVKPQQFSLIKLIKSCHSEHLNSKIEFEKTELI